jgi:DNA polymerase III delta prime subunit
MTRTKPAVKSAPKAEPIAIPDQLKDKPTQGADFDIDKEQIKSISEEEVKKLHKLVTSEKHEISVSLITNLLKEFNPKEQREILSVTQVRLRRSNEDILAKLQKKCSDFHELIREY